MTSILLVDDDDEFRAILREVLMQAGYQVEEASDGVQAMKRYGSDPADLVITDLVMPEKEGLELIRELRRLYPDAKIIAISGGGEHGSQDYLKMAAAFGAQRVLSKPFARDEILEAVKQVLFQKA